MPLKCLRQPIAFPAQRNLCPDKGKVKHFQLADFAAGLDAVLHF
jgi:hypothetical protein